MNINTETLNEFLAMASHVSTWENAKPGMWVRSRKTEKWLPTLITDDPYTTLPSAVSLTPEGDRTEVIMLMYGTATHLDDEMGDTPTRVRVIMYFHDGDQCVAVQVQGRTLANEFDDIGEGLFPETLKKMRASQKAGEWL